VGDRASTPAGENQIGSSWSSWGPVRSILTLSTGYQRLQPRIITRSCPFHLLTATIGPSGQLTRIVPKNACSTRAALIWRTLVDCTLPERFAELNQR
jgi:hypothetical protein